MNKPSEQFDPRRYWEDRAGRFGDSGGGWKAVCFQGAPEIYNRLLHRLQGRALRRELLPAAGGSVLEFGCGVGRWGEELAGNFARFCGLDISREMLKRARERLPASGRSALCRFDGSRIPFRSGSFDLIFSVTVLIHIVDEEVLERAVGEMARVVSRGGRIIILECFSPGESSPPHLRFRPEDQVAELFRRAGWRLISSRPVYFLFPPEGSLSSRLRRVLARPALPGYYLLNLLNQRWEISRRPIQKIQVYRYE